MADEKGNGEVNIGYRSELVSIKRHDKEPVTNLLFTGREQITALCTWTIII